MMKEDMRLIRQATMHLDSVVGTDRSNAGAVYTSILGVVHLQNGLIDQLRATVDELCEEVEALKHPTSHREIRWIEEIATRYPISMGMLRRVVPLGSSPSDCIRAGRMAGYGMTEKVIKEVMKESTCCHPMIRMASKMNELGILDDHIFGVMAPTSDEIERCTESIHRRG